ncbi:PREDICTED: centrosomal protein of 85 kDa isoform X1 [Miniopterus natalensis]|uniref:centrosomal protein of 85 kDa isoform X1 n=2 Tax=Miniopterus natalensis TaxID=291302 RepID=UPI0007A6EEF2|nr:PREDICTED: centrosomal protein of 85 kDa isoform X1 [Miniopterus natalensis]XP_016071988.1 PREDICTED: centrosomal protein of 85 kDa isoform X1 [Miniopterus natalensis]
MAMQEKYPSERNSHATSPGSNVIQKSSSLGCEWQTPVISEAFRSRFSRCSSVADSGDTAIGTSCSDMVEDFCSSSSGPSFQPIKSHVTIPTAHVMPSTLGTSPAKPNSTPAGPSSSKISLSGLTESVGMTRNGDLGAMKRSPGLSRDFMYHCGAAGENGIEQPWFPAVGHEREEEMRKFDIPSVESTLNQSAMVETLYSDPRYRVHFHNLRTDPNKELYKGLPETKKAPGSGMVCERNGLHPSSNGLLPLGIQPAPGLSKPLPSQVWQPNSDPWNPRERSCELSTCRQHLELIRLQMEQMQLQNGATCHHPAAFAPSLPMLEPAQWLSILNSNEHLLKEKELLIDKQRKHISQLEQKVRESELQVHSALLGRPAPFGDVCLLRLQELQRENTFLRAQFAQKTEALNKEKIELERKLAASEVEVQLIRESLKVALQKHSEEGKKQEERVKGRDKHINNLKKKCQKESEQNREKQQRIETLERYLADLPTLEDHQKQSQQLKDSELKSTELQERVTELEGLLEETQAACREKEVQLESLRQREAEFSTGHSLQDKQYVEASGEGPAQQEEGPKMEMESWQKECDSLRKIVEKQQQKMGQLRSQVQSLEQQVAQEEGTSQALKEEAQQRETALQQLRTAVKELSAQNQDLIEKNLTLQEHLRQAQPGSPSSPDTAQLAFELHQELASCLQDLQAVCSVVTQSAQGHDPNLSLLLGIHSAQHPGTPLDLQKPDVIRRKLEEVQQLRHDIEDLRTTMSDRYAQDMGENCVTQ